MKKLCPILLALLLLTACGAPKETAPAQYIQPAQLTAVEEAMAQLLGYDGGYCIFDFVVDDTVQSMSVQTYELVDGGWEPALTGDRCALEGGPGRVALDFDRLDGAMRIAIQDQDGTSAVTHQPPELEEDELAVTTSLLSEQTEIVCGQEIPLAVQIVTSRDQVHTYGVEGFYQPELYAGDDHEHIYALAVSFHQEPLS